MFITELKKKRQFRKFSYRGIELEQYVFAIYNAPFSFEGTELTGV